MNRRNFLGKAFASVSALFGLSVASCAKRVPAPAVLPMSASIKLDPVLTYNGVSIQCHNYSIFPQRHAVRQDGSVVVETVIKIHSGSITTDRHDDVLAKLMKPNRELVLHGADWVGQVLIESRGKQVTPSFVTVCEDSVDYEVAIIEERIALGTLVYNGIVIECLNGNWTESHSNGVTTVNACVYGIVRESIESNQLQARLLVPKRPLFVNAGSHVEHIVGVDSQSTAPKNCKISLLESFTEDVAHVMFAVEFARKNHCSPALSPPFPEIGDLT